MTEPKTPLDPDVQTVPSEPIRRIECLTPMLEAWERSVDSLVPIQSVESPQEILAADFKSGELPIRGGWGYSLETACVIDKHHPIASKGVPFNLVAVEYAFVERRIYEEMIIFRRKGTQFFNIEWKLLLQENHIEDGRIYDRLEFEITAVPEVDWESLMADWESPDGFKSSTFNEEGHKKARERATVSLVREFWFDVTSAT